MRPHVTRAFTVLGLALVAWGLFVFVGRSAALDAANRTIAAQKEENAAIVEAALRQNREIIRAESLKLVQVRRDLHRERAKSMHILDSANMATLGNMAMLRDSSATVPQLRGALSNAIQTNEVLAGQFRAYLMSDSTYHAQERVERIALYRSLTLADSTILALKEVNQALRKVGECRIIGPIRCPTRTQSAVGGALITLGVFMAVR